MSRLTETPPTTSPSMTIGLTVDSIQSLAPSGSRTVPSPRQARPAASVSCRSGWSPVAEISNGNRSPNDRPIASCRLIPNRRSAESAQNVTRLSRSVAKAASFIRSSSSPSRTPGGGSSGKVLGRHGDRIVLVTGTSISRPPAANTGAGQWGRDARLTGRRYRDASVELDPVAPSCLGPVQGAVAEPKPGFSVEIEIEAADQGCADAD